MTQELPPTEAKTMLRAGDDEDEIRRILETAIASGSTYEGKLYIAIPVGDELAPWGLSTWHYPEDGSITRANDFFAGILSEVTGREICITGFGPNTAEGADRAQSVLHGFVKSHGPQLPVIM